MGDNYQVLDMEDNFDGSANILIRSQGVYFLLMNVRDGAEGAVYDVVFGREAESGGVEWLNETESPQEYIAILDAVIDDVLKGE